MAGKRKRRIIVGMTGASGALYGLRLLECLHRTADVETHLVVSENGERLIRLELGAEAGSLKSLATHVHGPADLEAPIASGTFPVDGMVVIPCSIKSLSSIAHAYADNLLVRAADVTLKQRRPLVLVVRETPLHEGHLELMLKASRFGAVVMPACPGFYASPATIGDLADQIAGKALDLLDIENDLYQRWGSQVGGGM